MQSVMNHSFSTIPRAEIPRSVFDRSHGYKTTFDAGYLVPILVDEMLPGDTLSCRANIFARLTTPIVPIMDNVFLETFYFAVPYRLVWSNWKRFNGEQDNAYDPDNPPLPTDYLIPTMEPPTGGYGEQSVYDYMGLPTKVDGFEHMSLPLRAMNLIWNEWFRDQNLQDPVSVPTGDGPDSHTLYTLLKRNKKHDYFTSCLPFPQKGPGVEIPLGDTAPVWGNGKSLGLSYYATPALGPWGMYAGSQGGDLRVLSFSSQAYDQDLGTTISPSGSATANKVVGVVTKEGLNGTQLESGLYADLSEATAATINSLRTAFQIQKMYERDARGGSRYTEIIRSHFGILSPDGRQQRPEYLGGSSSRVMINPVQQTSQSTEDSPQGNLAAYGLVTDFNGGFVKSFTEHTIIIAFANVRADLTYQKSLNRMWSRQQRFDFYFPALAHLGEQEVLNKEIYCDGTTADEDVFGYQERFAEYRYKPSLITGRFRSNSTIPLDVWHLSENFTTRPSLNETFIQDSSTTTVDRAIAVQSEPQFLIDIYFNYKHARPMPVYSVPGLMDHF